MSYFTFREEEIKIGINVPIELKEKPAPNRSFDDQIQDVIKLEKRMDELNKKQLHPHELFEAQ